MKELTNEEFDAKIEHEVKLGKQLEVPPNKSEEFQCFLCGKQLERRRLGKVTRNGKGMCIWCAGEVKK